MPSLPEDDWYDYGDDEAYAEAIRTTPPDWVEGNKITGRDGVRFRGILEGQGPAINALMAREQTKTANLRARLHDFGIEKERHDKCYVDAHANPSEDMVTMPWSVIYDLINRDNGKIVADHMGVQR